MKTKKQILDLLEEIKNRVIDIPFENIEELDHLLKKLDPNELYSCIAFGEYEKNSSDNNYVQSLSTKFFEARPMIPIIPKRLIIMESTAKYFDISDIRIGINSEFLSIKSWPAELFAGNVHTILKNKNRENPFKFNTCDVGMIMTIEVKNNDTKPQKFGAIILGITKLWGKAGEV